MNDVIEKVKRELFANSLSFTQKPLLIGGMAMEYYSMRKAGADIDLVVTDEDYQRLSLEYPDSRRDFWGDLGVAVGPFEIWRSIACIDYTFYTDRAVDEGDILVVSPDRLLLMRVFARDVPKYAEDLKKMDGYYRGYYSDSEYVDGKFSNLEYVKGYFAHIKSYEKFDGKVFGGNYID